MWLSASVRGSRSRVNLSDKKPWFLRREREGEREGGRERWYQWREFLKVCQGEGKPVWARMTGA